MNVRGLISVLWRGNQGTPSRGLSWVVGRFGSDVAVKTPASKNANPGGSVNAGPPWGALTPVRGARLDVPHLPYCYSPCKRPRGYCSVCPMGAGAQLSP
jgi:hypothetical protein